jgi:hypothetical protein
VYIDKTVCGGGGGGGGLKRYGRGPTDGPASSLPLSHFVGVKAVRFLNNVRERPYTTSVGGYTSLTGRQVTSFVWGCGRRPLLCEGSCKDIPIKICFIFVALK